MSFINNEELENLPYTVIGHTAIPSPTMHIALTGKGLKSIADQVEDEDTVHIKMWSDYSNEGASAKHYQRITVSRKAES